MQDRQQIIKAIQFLNTHFRRPLVLVGMMGAGKSHVGSNLARALSRQFHDTDRLVESRAGCSVSEIFERFGEDKFRAAEKNIVLDLLEDNKSVIATGGGAVIDPETLHAINEKAVSIWLNADIDLIVERVEGRDDRPLLNGEDPHRKISALLKERKSLYAKADIKIDITAANAGETTERAIKSLSDHVNPDSV